MLSWDHPFAIITANCDPIKLMNLLYFNWWICFTMLHFALLCMQWTFMEVCPRSHVIFCCFVSFPFINLCEPLKFQLPCISLCNYLSWYSYWISINDFQVMKSIKNEIVRILYQPFWFQPLEDIHWASSSDSRTYHSAH